MSKEPAAVTSSNKYSTLTSSSLLDLRAQLSAKESEFASTRHLGSTTHGVKRPGVKPTAWQRSNKGLSSRQARDQVLFEEEGKVQGKDPAQVRAVLERKAKLYEKIKKGKSAGLTEGQINNLLVDFDGAESDSSSSSEDESSTVPLAGPSDPLIEWTDEFGRTRMIPRSEVPRGTAGTIADAEGPAPSNITYGDQHIFPIYAPPPALLAARLAALESTSPLVQHYDSTLENRQRGAGFMAFSQDEEEREGQMRGLREERERTEREREKGVQGGGVKGEREREREERKRKVEGKRRELEAKRRKKGG